MKKIKKITILSCAVLTVLSVKVFASTATVNVTATRVRKSASTDSDIITNIYQDDKVEVIENDGEWCKIKYDGNTGYVKTSFLSISGSTTSKNTNTSKKDDSTTSNKTLNEAEAQTNSDNNSTTTNTNQVNNADDKIKLRLLPSISSKVISEVSKGSLTQISEINNWVKVTDGTQVGWVSNAKFNSNPSEVPEVPEVTASPESTLDPEQTATPTPTPTPTQSAFESVVNSKGKINVETAKVREKASSSATVKTFLDLNDEVTILEEDGDWYKIESGDVTGYVNKKLVTLNKVSSRSLTESREESSNDVEEDNTVASTEENGAINTALASGVETANKGTQVVEFAKQYLGYSYVSGGKTPDTGFDCSGFTKYIYSNFGYTLGSTAASQNSNGTDVVRENLQIGDLILFYDEGNTKIGHTGIYMGDGNFIHAANSKRGVVTDNLNSNSYYNTRFVNAKRIVE